MMVRWSSERQVNVKSQSELVIGGCEIVNYIMFLFDLYLKFALHLGFLTFDLVFSKSN